VRRPNHLLRLRTINLFSLPRLAHTDVPPFLLSPTSQGTKLALTADQLASHNEATGDTTFTEDPHVDYWQDDAASSILERAEPEPECK